MPEGERRSTLDLLDTWLLVLGAIVAALVVLKIVGWIVGTVLFLIKVALVAFVIAVAMRLFLRSRSD